MHSSVVRQPPAERNIIERTRAKLELAQSLGFQIREELTDSQEATWCEVGDSKFLFINLALGVVEQLDQLDRLLAEYQQRVITPSTGSPARPDSD